MALGSASDQRSSFRARTTRSPSSPNLTYSSGIEPRPAPKTTRPPDSRSIVATCCASRDGRRRGTAVISAPGTRSCTAVLSTDGGGVSEISGAGEVDGESARETCPWVVSLRPRGRAVTSTILLAPTPTLPESGFDPAQATKRRLWGRTPTGVDGGDDLVDLVHDEQVDAAVLDHQPPTPRDQLHSTLGSPDLRHISEVAGPIRSSQPPLLSPTRDENKPRRRQPKRAAHRHHAPAVVRRPASSQLLALLNRWRRALKTSDNPAEHKHILSHRPHPTTCQASTGLRAASRCRPTTRSGPSVRRPTATRSWARVSHLQRHASNAYPQFTGTFSPRNRGNRRLRGAGRRRPSCSPWNPTARPRCPQTS